MAITDNLNALAQALVADQVRARDALNYALANLPAGDRNLLALSDWVQSNDRHTAEVAAAQQVAGGLADCAAKAAQYDTLQAQLNDPVNGVYKQFRDLKAQVEDLTRQNAQLRAGTTPAVTPGGGGGTVTVNNPPPSSTGLYVGITAAVLALGVGGYWMYANSKKKPAQAVTPAARRMR